MILYHGSNAAVPLPDVSKGKLSVDFGQAFYLTSDFEQAKRWAQVKTSRLKKGMATVSEYFVDDNCLDPLNILTFEGPNAEWLRLISRCRTDLTARFEQDIIIGPVADDNTFDTIQLYLNGVYDEEEALRRLLPHKLKDQYAFKTQKAIDLLQFKREVYV